MTAKILNAKGLAELAKRVPPNQIKQFEEFRNKTLEYHRRVNSLPNKLRPIDWDFYRRHVRDSFVELVEQFQIKYEELDHSFAKRHEVLDHSKYYKEWEELEAQVRLEVTEFIEASKDRVRVYEEELRRLKNLNYENMTMEEFIEARPDGAHLIPGQGKPLFWPHTAEEQIAEYPKNLKTVADKEKNKKQAEATTTENKSREKAANKSEGIKIDNKEEKKDT